MAVKKKVDVLKKVEKEEFKAVTVDDHVKRGVGAVKVGGVGVANNGVVRTMSPARPVMPVRPVRPAVGGHYNNNRTVRPGMVRPQSNMARPPLNAVRQEEKGVDFKGFLDVLPEGHGFLRPNFVPSRADAYLPTAQIRRFGLRKGDLVEGKARLPRDNERYRGFLRVEKVNGMDPVLMLRRKVFRELTPIYPDKMVKLETKKEILSTRLIDLLAPIGFGQRGMIVSPPKAGKTWLLKEIAAGVAVEFPQRTFDGEFWWERGRKK